MVARYSLLTAGLVLIASAPAWAQSTSPEGGDSLVDQGSACFSVAPHVQMFEDLIVEGDNDGDLNDLAGTFVAYGELTRARSLDNRSTPQASWWCWEWTNQASGALRLSELWLYAGVDVSRGVDWSWTVERSQRRLAVEPVVLSTADVTAGVIADPRTSLAVVPVQDVSVNREFGDTSGFDNTVNGEPASDATHLRICVDFAVPTPVDLRRLAASHFFIARPEDFTVQVHPFDTLGLPAVAGVRALHADVPADMTDDGVPYGIVAAGVLSASSRDRDAIPLTHEGTHILDSHAPALAEHIRTGTRPDWLYAAAASPDNPACEPNCLYAGRHPTATVFGSPPPVTGALVDGDDACYPRREADEGQCRDDRDCRVSDGVCVFGQCCSRDSDRRCQR